MQVYGLGLTTELGIAGLSGRVVDRGDYLVVTNPDEPGYYYGNYLVLRAAPQLGEVAYWSRKFAEEIGGDPRIRHVTLRWDGIHGDVGAREELEAAGFRIDSEWVMTADEVSAPRAVAAIEMRELVVDDMPLVAALDFAIGDRHDEHYRQFLQRRATTKRGLVERGLARWWGAFDRTLPPSDALVGSLGLVPLAVGVARYQDVQVAATHRRRGIAAALLGVSARERGRVVIVAEPDSEAARVYTRAGFQISERTASACRYPVS